MLKQKELSIIIICKNNPVDLKNTLDSLIKFNEIDNINFWYEILIIDKSNNKLIEDIYNKYKISLFKNIRYIKQLDEGIFFAFNVGVKNAFGKYVWFLNSGDKVIKNINIELFTKHLSNINFSMLIFKTEVFSPLLNKIIGEQPLFFPKNILVYKLLNQLFPYSFGYCHQSTIFKKDFHLRNLYKHPKRLGQDSKLIKKVLNSKDYKLINMPLSIFYRGGISSSIPKTRNVFFQIFKDRILNLQFTSAFFLVIKYFYFRDDIQLEKAIDLRNKVLRNIFFLIF